MLPYNDVFLVFDYRFNPLGAIGEYVGLLEAVAA